MTDSRPASRGGLPSVPEAAQAGDDRPCTAGGTLVEESAQLAGFAVAAFQQASTIGKFKLSQEKVKNALAADKAELAAQAQEEEEQAEVEFRYISEHEVIGASHLLADLPLFADCSRYMLEAVAAECVHFSLPDGTPLSLKDNGELYILEHGAIQVTVGMGPATTAVRGACFNNVGLLGLHKDCQIYKPRGHKAKATPFAAGSGADNPETSSPYEVIGYGGAPPRIFESEEAASRCSTADYGQAGAHDVGSMLLRPDVGCMYTLCPHSCMSVGGRQATAATVDSGPAPTPVGGPRSEGGWLPLSAVGINDQDGTETKILRVPIHAFDEVRKKHSGMGDFDVAIRKSLDRFRETVKVVSTRWLSLLKHCSQDIFPGVPPDVMWAISEVSSSIVEEPGHDLVTEGDHHVGGEDLVVLENGVATVEKLCGISGIALQTTIGRIRPGAIIGDLCYLGCSMPRAASVRAKTRVEACLMPAAGLISVLSKFPGMLESCENQLVAASEFMQAQLPTRVTVLGSLKLFAPCDGRFIAMIAHACSRQMYFCGQVIIEQNMPQTMLYVIEYGRCSVEKAKFENVGHGSEQVNQLAMGTAFGVLTLLGVSETASATVRVLSPCVLALAVPQEALNNALNRLEGIEWQHFEKMKKSSALSQQKGGHLKHIELFRPCSSEFIDCLAGHLKTICFMPGQTVIVQNHADDPSMFAIMGGTLIVERCGQQVTQMKSGATFGELVMLDYATHRSCTVRAQSFCVLVEIPRPGFTDAVLKHPENMRHFKGFDDSKVDVVRWPCLQGAPEHLQYLLDLYAVQYKVDVKPKHLVSGFDEHDDSLGTVEKDMTHLWTLKACAFVVQQGTAVVVDAQGDELESLEAGQCRDYHYMLDLPDGDPIVLIRPSWDCKIRVVSKEIWDKVLAEFPDKEDECRVLIREYSVKRAQEKLGFEPGSTESLCLSALFRPLSTELVQIMVDGLVSRLCTPGSEMIAPEQEEKGMYIVLSGHVCVEDPHGQMKPSVGRIFGETVLLGISNHYPYTVEALSLCTVQFLDKGVFENILETSTADFRIVNFLQRESLVNGANIMRLRKCLQQCQSFKSASPAFVAMLSEELEAVFYAPNDIIFKYGDDCFFGEAPFYLLLAGQVNVESKLGVRLGSVKAVEVFGEGAAPGTGGKRSATVMAWEVGLVYCARIPGEAMARAFEKFPDQIHQLIELFQSRQAANVNIELNRRTWLKETAMPALISQPIFETCALQFLWALATPLHQTNYERGKTIVNVGEEAHSMHIVLNGEVAVESSNGTRVSVLTEGASFGEVAMLGLLPTRTATYRCISNEACLLEVTSLALQHALSTKYAGKTTERFKQYVRARQDQVSLGRPLSYLKINTSPEDVSVSTISLHAQKVCFMSGDIWQPMPDGGPNGPRFSIVASGRSILEMTQSQRKVMTLPAGSMIIEGIAADFGASVRSTTNPCEIYQIFLNDFKIAVGTVSAANNDWIWRFKVQEKAAIRDIKERLQNMHGLIEGLAPNSHDEEIKDWRATREGKIKVAKKRRDYRDGKDDVDDNKLPCISVMDSVEDFPLVSSSSKSDMRSPLSKSKKSEHQMNFGSALSAYPSLPLIQTESSFTKSGRSLNRGSRSEILLHRVRE